MHVSQALSWILFLSLFPLAFVWLRRAWRILAQRNYEEVALKWGEPPANAARFAPYTAMTNLAAGGVAAVVIVLIVVGGLSYDRWTAIAGSTIWMKLVADFLVSRHAHARQKPKAP